MTEVADFDAEFLNVDFLDDILSSDFIDEVLNSALQLDNGGDVEPTKTIHFDDDERIKHDVNISKLMRCQKRKQSDAKMVDKTKNCKKRRPSIEPQSPNIDLLKKAVERFKNVNKSIDYRSDVVEGDINEFTGIEGRQRVDHINQTKSIQMQDQPHLQKIVTDILKGFKVMIIMRGAPGCGKSFLAREIIDSTTKDSYADHIFSAADFFYNEDGCHNFNPTDVGRSHQWNQARINSHVRNGWSPIIIDNTNMKKWEMKDFVKTAVQCGYLVEIVEPNTPWSKSVVQLAAVNIHDVPKKTIERMLSKYEPTTVCDLMSGLKYTMEMPQYRRLPPLSYHVTLSK